MPVHAGANRHFGKRTATQARCPYLIVGWLWYLIMLLPVIGLIPVGTHGMADRYTYLTHIGLYVALAWGAADMAKTWSIRPWIGVVSGSLMLIA